MMSRRVWLPLLAGFLIAGGVVGYAMYQDHVAEELIHEAIGRLQAPLEEAPSLDRIQASTAISLLERAGVTGRNDRQIEQWVHFARSIEYLQRGDLVFAQREIELGEQLGDVPAELLLASAEIHRRATRLEEAKRSLEAALETAPDHPRVRLVAAEIALDENDGERAADLLRELVTELPQVGRLHARLGLALEQLGEFGEAQAAFGHALEHNPRDRSSWINLGRLHHQRDKPQEADEAFSRALDLDATDPDALLGRGLARAALGNIEEAAQDLQAAAEASPNEAEPWLALGDLQRQAGQVTEAIETYREALRREDADAASWLKLGNALVLATELNPAIQAFREAIDRAPTLGPAHNGLGAALMRQGQHQAARSALLRACELTPSDISPRLNLGLVEEALANPEAAAAAWQEALSIQPNHPLATRKLQLLQGS